MLKIIKALLKHRNLIIATFVTLSIIYLSLIKLGKSPINISNLDKIYHCIAYFVLALMWLIAIRKAKNDKKITYSIVVVCILFGIIVEVLQTTLTSYREASYLDILANSVGVLLAFFTFNFFKKKQAI